MKLPVNQIICGDCLEVMKDWPDGCVDLVLTDPPYPKEFDYVWGYLGTSYRVLKDGGFLGTLCGHYQMPLVIDTLREAGFDWFWPCLHENNNQPIMFGFKVKVCHKPFLWFRKGKGLPNRIFYDNFSLRCKTTDWKEAQSHHKWGQDSSMLWEPIDAFSSPDSIILDPFCGSGTTCVAAKKLGRNYIGIDISPEYCEIARKRLKGVKPNIFEKLKKKKISESFGLKVKSRKRKQ